MIDIIYICMHMTRFFGEKTSKGQINFSILISTNYTYFLSNLVHYNFPSFLRIQITDCPGHISLNIYYFFLFYICMLMITSTLDDNIRILYR